MGTWIIRWLGLTTMAIAGFAAQPKPAPDVTVYLTAAEVFLPYAAEQTASTMFRAIDVRVAWASGKPKPAASGLTVKVKLEVDTPANFQPGTLAIAYPFAGMERCVVVFFDRVRDLAAQLQIQENVLLSHVLVHEITHMIQRIDRHSDDGIMKEHWTPRDFLAMSQRPLAFAPDDVYFIRRGLDTSGDAAPVIGDDVAALVK